MSTSHYELIGRSPRALTGVSQCLIFSFSDIFLHFLSFSFIFFHFLSFSFSLLGAQNMIFFVPQFRYDFS